MPLRLLTFLLAFGFFFTTGPTPAAAKSHKRKAHATAAGNFDYYLLTLSFAPDFCDQPAGKKDPRECGAGRHVGFIVHGLWPQNNAGHWPEKCAPASPVASGIVQTMLRYMPTEGLIQHEWAAHGTCTGLTPSAYFATVRRAREAIKIPPSLDQPTLEVETTPNRVISQIQDANPSFPKDSIRVSCYRTGELQEVRVCLSKDLKPIQCTPSAGHCNLDKIVLLPTR